MDTKPVAPTERLNPRQVVCLLNWFRSNTGERTHSHRTEKAPAVDCTRANSIRYVNHIVWGLETLIGGG